MCSLGHTKSQLSLQPGDAPEEKGMEMSLGKAREQHIPNSCERLKLFKVNASLSFVHRGVPVAPKSWDSRMVWVEKDPKDQHSQTCHNPHCKCSGVQLGLF